MNKPLRALFDVAVLSLLLTLMFPGILRAEDAPRVNSIEIQGLRRIDEGTVRERISQRLGASLSPEAVSEDIKALYGTGYFEDIRVEVEPFEGGFKIIYIMKEKPSIRRVEIYGNEELDDSKLGEKLTISSGSIADTVLIQQNVNSLRLTYEEEGRPLATVVPIMSEISPGNVLLTFYIEEGPKVKIRHIVIKGNEKISGRKIKGAMETSSWRWYKLPWLFSSGHYEKREMAQDVERVKEFYHDRGFIKAEVLGPSIELSEDKKEMTITLEVVEGEQYVLSGLGFRGNSVFTAEELLKVVQSTLGEPVSRKALREDVTALTGMYTERGYALASVYPDIEPDDEAREARVVFRVNEDEIYRIGRIEVSGNVKTRDKVIRREMRLNEGDVFNSKLLARSYERLVNLNFFEDIKLNPQPDAERKTLDIDINVAERATGFMNIGGGYSNTDKLLGMVDVTLGNLGGRGQYLKVKAEFSSRTTTYEVDFREPWLFDRPISLDVGVYRTEREYTSYSKKAVGFNLGFGRSFREYWRAGILYSLEEATIFDLDEDVSSIILEQEGTSLTSSVSPSLSRDTRDNFLNPHRGSKNAVILTYAGLGGDNHFVKVHLDSSWYLPVTERTTFSIRGRYGYATGIEGEELPLYERYFAGSSLTLRGLRDVGPRDDEGNYIGGRERLLFNFDYVFPLISSIKINGNVFYDVGAVYDDDPEEFRESAGAGIRWISPIGPLGLQWAYILDRKKGEPKSRWEITLGTFF